MSLTNNNTVKVSIKETSLFDIWSFMLSLQQSTIKFGWLFGWRLQWKQYETLSAK